MQTKAASADVIGTHFSSDGLISLSSPAITTFYNNQYKYFLQYVLSLQEAETTHPDVRSRGAYLHRIFGLIIKDDLNHSSDSKLNKVIQTTDLEDDSKFVYEEDKESRYSLTALKDIARGTATILRDSAQIQVESEKGAFKLMIANSVRTKGIIDCANRLSDGSLGIVGYKSSRNTFDI